LFFLFFLLSLFFCPGLSLSLKIKTAQRKARDKRKGKMMTQRPLVEKERIMTEMLLREYVNGFQLQDLKKTQMKLEVIDGYILVTIS